MRISDWSSDVCSSDLIEKLDVELPRLESLLHIAGTYDAPVRNVTVRGLRFSHTSWRGPNGPEGYASQQSGSYLTGRAAAYPADPLVTRSEEHTSELQSLMRISYAVLCLQKKNKNRDYQT